MSGLFRRPLRSITHFLRSRRKKWEAVCHRCGFCCCDRTLSGSGELVVELSSPCEHLDPETRLCMIYERRFSLCPECRRVTIFHALFSRYLPGSCGYVTKYRFWRRPGASRSRSRALPEESGGDAPQ